MTPKHRFQELRRQYRLGRRFVRNGTLTAAEAATIIRALEGRDAGRYANALQYAERRCDLSINALVLARRVPHGQGARLLTQTLRAAIAFRYYAERPAYRGLAQQDDLARLLAYWRPYRGPVNLNAGGGL